MIYGHNKTIHRTKKLNIEVDKKGNVVAVWFRCMPLPFDVTVCSKERAEEMKKMYAGSIMDLLAVDVKENIK